VNSLTHVYNKEGDGMYIQKYILPFSKKQINQHKLKVKKVHAWLEMA